MVYGLYLALDQPRWFIGDFSSDNALTGTIYSDVNQVTAKNLTGYTLVVRMHRPLHFGDWFGKTASIVVAGDGTWKYNLTQGDTPPRGIYYVKLELTKSGVQESTINRVEIEILGGANQ